MSGACSPLLRPRLYGLESASLGVAYDPNLRWHYFSSMTWDEALLLKVFDSADDRAKWTAHGAFVNPQAPTDAAPRGSIEVRTLLSFAQ